MNRLGNVPVKPGVYALVGHINGEAKIAYVGVCANLRHRAAVWDYNFSQRQTNPQHKMPVRNIPLEIPSDAWTYLSWEEGTHTIDQIRASLQQLGIQLLNDKTRVHEMMNYNGKTATFAEHCRDHNINYSRAYARLKKGKSLEQVFALPGMQKST